MYVRIAVKSVHCVVKATKHYENMLGMVVFVCDDCYKEVKNN